MNDWNAELLALGMGGLVSETRDECRARVALNHFLPADTAWSEISGKTAQDEIDYVRAAD